MNLITLVRKLAKTDKAQNNFTIAKELHGMKLFRNSHDFSKLQGIYLSFLYMYDSILRDIALENISELVLKDEIFSDAYVIWKRKKQYKSQESNKNNYIHIVAGNKITFPKEGK